MELLKDKVAVITGGTRGIGFEVAKAFLENGAKVIVFGSREESVNKAKEEYRKLGHEVEGYFPDLLSESDVKDTMKKIHDEYGKIDILVNVAGISDNIPTKDADLEHFKRVIDINLIGTYNCIQNVIEYMVEENNGSIINFSSMVSKNGQPTGVGYPTSKFAINGLTISLARELGPKNIRVNAVAPGVTNTDMVAALPPEQIDPIVQMIPMRRVGEPDEVAKAVLFLASDLASYVNGSILGVDGATII